MKEMLFYVHMIKGIIDRYYEKETVFYDEGEWYSRYHSRNITQKELADWVAEITYVEEDDLFKELEEC